MAMEGASRPYSVSSIKVGTFDEAVRRRPKLYFGLDQADPGLVVAVVQFAAVTPFAWALKTGDALPAVQVIIRAGMRFTLSFNSVLPGTDPGSRPPVRRALIFEPQLAPVAAVSTRTVAEVRAGGRAWRQELAGAQPLAAPRDCGACDQLGTRATFDLDPGFFAAGAQIPRAHELTADLGLDGGFDLSACNLAVTDLRPSRRLRRLSKTATAGPWRGLRARP
jgi:hypothetical protein